jgi:hypothetical protein
MLGPRRKKAAHDRPEWPVAAEALPLVVERRGRRCEPDHCEFRPLLAPLNRVAVDGEFTHSAIWMQVRRST